MAKKFLTSIDLTGNDLLNANNVYTKAQVDSAGALKVDKTTTVNSKPLSGSITLVASDITASTDKNYVTDAQLVVLNNTSGTNTGDETTTTIKSKLGITTLSGINTGDQTITLTGDVTGSGTGSFTVTITDGVIGLTKQADIASNTIIGNNTGGATKPIALTIAQVKTMLGLTGGLKYASNVGNGTLTSIPVVHSLNTTDVCVSVYEVSSKVQVFPDVTLTDNNTVTLGFTIAPTVNQYRVVILA